MNRDGLGWRIPRRGTKSYAIYLRLKDHASATKIARELGSPVGTVRVSFTRSNTERANATAQKCRV